MLRLPALLCSALLCFALLYSALPALPALLCSGGCVWYWQMRVHQCWSTIEQFSWCLVGVAGCGTKALIKVAGCTPPPTHALEASNGTIACCSAGSAIPLWLVAQSTPRLHPLPSRMSLSIDESHHQRCRITSVVIRLNCDPVRVGLP